MWWWWGEKNIRKQLKNNIRILIYTTFFWKGGKGGKKNIRK